MTAVRFQTEAVPKYPRPSFVEITCPWKNDFFFFRFSVLRPQKPSGLLVTKNDHVDFHTAPEL